MKKLTLNQIYAIVDYLKDCNNDYEDDYSLRAVNHIMKILNYKAKFTYDYENDALIWEGAIDTGEDE